MALRSALVNVMDGAARKAARGLVRDFGEVEQLQVSKKGPADFVSRADRRAEQIIREHLQGARPSFGFLMEESGAVPGQPGEPRWIIDPLDGTTNFLHGIPHFCISIAVEDKGEIIAGLIYDPLHDETFWADKGQGAYLNDRRIRVSARQSLSQCVVVTGIPHLGRGDHEQYLHILAGMMPAVAGIRRYGAAALDLAYVAAGRFDAYWEESLHIWDVAAGVLIVREAGGFVTDYAGASKMTENGEIVAANDIVHAPFLKIVKAGRALKRAQLQR
jgi:myo-inositol-1(or 4)-monophosphatase